MEAGGTRTVNKVAIGVDGQINVGVVGIGKMGILHTGILSSLDDVDVEGVADKEICLCLLNVWMGD